MTSKLPLVLILLIGLVDYISGHGMVLEPVGRGSRWRFDPTAPADYNDNEGYCGGFFNQVNLGGKCGLCGDDYKTATPRPHEIGGTYGQGVIVKTYYGSEIPVSVKLTTNHKGYFLFDLCNMDHEAESEECFAKYKLNVPGIGHKYSLPSYESGMFETKLTIPSGLTCKHCVLRWTYIAGNSWGTCEDGTQATGCGPQENFRTCSDISIMPSFHEEIETPEEI